ncbi:MAG: VOC family protein [Gammaproteobacteria bacterium]|nr:VOC family protein [Gammaproteobacteria bacterium]NND61225.1 VOC family protein [Gammaproteobacteria bacterium]
MIGYVTLGTNDLEKATAFYDALFAEIGIGRLMQGDNFVAWGASASAPALSVITPFDGEPASAGNGTMVALVMSSKEQVEQLHRKAIELGATNEGDAGPRGDTFYAGYFRDPDGNKLNAFVMTPTS